MTFSFDELYTGDCVYKDGVGVDKYVSCIAVELVVIESQFNSCYYIYEARILTSPLGIPIG